MTNFPASYYAPEYLKMHTRALKNTVYGSGNVVEAIIDSGKIKFRLNSTGEILDTAQEAFNKASVTGLTQFTRLTGGSEGYSGSVRGLYGFDERVKNIKSTLGADEELMKRLGIKNVDELTFEISSAQIPQGADQAAKGVLKDISEGRGFMFATKDTATFVNARVKGRMINGQLAEQLTSLELNHLLQRTSLDATGMSAGGVFSEEAIMKAWSNGDIGGLMSKLPKRAKGLFSLDGVSLAGGDLQRIVTGVSGGEFSTMNQAIKVFDTQEDLSRIVESFISSKGIGSEEQIIRNAMIGKSTREIEEAVSFYKGSGALQSAIDSMERNGIISFKDGDFAKYIDEHADIAAVLRGEATAESLSDKSKRIYENLLDDFERPYDGSTLINKKFNFFMRQGMGEEMAKLERDQKAGRITEEGFRRLKELRADIQMTEHGMDADTIRFFYTDADNNPFLIKGVGTTAEFEGSLNNYIAVVAKVNLKKETAMAAGADAANIVFQGNAKDLVYLDPLAPGFHGEIFASEEAVEATRIRSQRVISQFKEALDNNIFDPKLRKEIYKAADQNIDDLPSEVQAVAARSKRYATLLKEAMESGRDIRSMPQLSNYLMNYVQSQVVREKGGMLQPVMEDTFRYSVDTELAYYSGRKVKQASLEPVTNLRLSAEAGAGEIGLMNFKIRGHKLLMAGDAANIFHHSLGTFDLDDKGIPVMRVMDTFNEEGVSIGQRIGFFTFRQPTGPGEYILSMGQFDVETIRGTFGKNEALVSHLNDLVSSGTASLGQERLYDIVSPESLSEDQINNLSNRYNTFLSNQAAVHEEMLRTMKEAEEKGAYKIVSMPQDIIKDLKGKTYGSTLAMDTETIQNLASRGFDGFNKKMFTSQYRQGNIFKVFAESGAYQLEDANRELIMNSALLTDAQKGEITAARAAAEVGYADQELMKKVGTFAKDNQSLKELVSEITFKELNSKTLKAQKLADPIGMYINRLTLATAPTRQATDIMAHLDESVVSRLLANHKVGLIDSSAAVDFATTLTIGNKILEKESLAHYTTDVYKDVTGAIETAMRSNADASGVLKTLLKLTGKQDELAAGGDAVKVLDIVGQQAVEDQGKFIGAVRAAAYKKGLTDPEHMLGIDSLILRERAKGGDIRNFLGGIISGFEEEHRIGGQPMGEHAQAFLSSLKEAQVLEHNDEVGAVLNKIIGISSGKYAGNTALSRTAHESNYAMRNIALAHGAMEKPFMSEMNLSQKAAEAAESVMNLHTLARNTWDPVLGEAGKLPQDYVYASHFANQDIGKKMYEGIFEAAKEKGVRVQDVIDHLDFMSSSRGGEKSLDRYITSGDAPNELMDLIQSARDSRKMSYYKRQEGLMGLVDQYDQFTMMAEGKDKNIDKQIITDTYHKYKGNSAYMASDDARLAEAIIMSDATATREALAATDEQFELVKQIRDASAVRESLAPMEATLAQSGDAITLAPTSLGETERLAMFGEEGLEASSGLAKNNFVKAARESFESGAMKRAIENPTIRKAGFAGLAVIAASFAYQHKKDRSPEDVAGPPLLPGGSSYEDMPQRSPQIPQASMFSGYDQGKSYSVNIEGSSDQINNFRSAAGSVAPGSVNSTMYKGLPRLGSNPYSQIASSY